MNLKMAARSLLILANPASSRVSNASQILCDYIAALKLGPKLCLRDPTVQQSAVVDCYHGRI